MVTPKEKCVNFTYIGSESEMFTLENINLLHDSHILSTSHE